MEQEGEPSSVGGVVQRNIAALLQVRRQVERDRSAQERIAHAVTSFTGSMRSVFLHAALFLGWIFVNSGFVPGIKPFDPFPFVMLAMAASVEAIFLTSFVLISQNRMSELSEQRAELDLQISLLSEHEITRVIQMVDTLCQHFGLQNSIPELEELKQDVAPERVLEEIENVEEAAKERDGPRLF